MRSKIDWDKKPKRKQGPREMGQFTDFKAAKVSQNFFGCDGFVRSRFIFCSHCLKKSP